MMRTPALRLLLTASLALAAGGLPHATPRTIDHGAAGVQAPKSGVGFTLGVLRRDGVVIPFAAWNGSQWLNRWPTPGRREDIPITVAGSPKAWWLNDRPAGYWTAWPLRGDSQVVYVKNPINLTAECQPQIGLQTDYRSIEAPAPAPMQPYPKDGLATAGDILIEPVTILDGKSAEWSKVSANVAAKITAAETKLLATGRTTPPFSEAERAKRPFTLEVLFRSAGPRPDTMLLYFEGVKHYGRTPESLRPYFVTAEPLTYAVGWILIDPQAPPRITEMVAFSDTKRDGLIYTMGLGSFRIGGTLYWAVQRSGWGFERFDIVEIAEPEVKTAFSTAGGSCR
jgi:hypothetical protein